MTVAILFVYFAALTALALFGVHRLSLTWSARNAAPSPVAPPPESWPTVVVQLPLYNEAFVAERVIRSAAALRYPVGRLTIQVLDDSTDDTAGIVNRVVTELRQAGHQVEAVRRPNRVGYKAGALAHGLMQSDAALVAIFDADFIPDSDYLERVVPTLVADPECGMVQARWAHLNRTRSSLTRAQALYLDGHFGVEHRARAATGHSFNFNGTAGVWRRAAIDEAGGWRDDTITEDLDLSYRSQLAGWRFAYRDDVLVPSELPESWMAFRAQQARWVRGSIETARRQLPSILRARQWSLSRRFEATIHVTSNATYTLMALIGVLLPLTVILRDRLGWMVPGGQWVLSLLDLSMLTAGTFAMIIFYGFAIHTDPDGSSRYRDLPFALCLGAGMSVSNASEVVRGLFSTKSEFVRTPKWGASAGRALEKYRSPKGTGLAALELLFCAYHLGGVVYAVYFGLWGAIPFLLLYAVGFGAVGSGVMRELVRRRAFAPLYSSSSSRTTSVT